jgi:hypothetical protein
VFATVHFVAGGQSAGRAEFVLPSRQRYIASLLQAWNKDCRSSFVVCVKLSYSVSLSLRHRWWINELESLDIGKSTKEKGRHEKTNAEKGNYTHLWLNGR